MNQAACEYHELVNYESEQKLEEAASWAEANYDAVSVTMADAQRYRDELKSAEEWQAVNTIMAMKSLADDLQFAANAKDKRAAWLQDQLRALAKEIEKRYE